jgi:hypothetical protein
MKCYVRGVLRIVGLFLLILCLGCQNGVVRYVPVGVDRTGEFVDIPERATRAHLEAFRVVLRDYGVEYIEKGGDVYIPRGLAQDRELLANYTTKAEDLQQLQWRPWWMQRGH